MSLDLFPARSSLPAIVASLLCGLPEAASRSSSLLTPVLASSCAYTDTWGSPATSLNGGFVRVQNK